METGDEAEVREDALSSHACFLIKNLSQRDEHTRDISVKLLSQLRDRFPQVNMLSTPHMAACAHVCVCV